MLIVQHRTCLGYTNLEAFVFKDETDRVENRHTRNRSPETSYASSVVDSAAQSRRGSQLSTQSDESLMSSLVQQNGRPVDELLFDYYNVPIPPGDALDQGSSLDILGGLPNPTAAFQLETFFYHRFIGSVWLHSQAPAWKEHLPTVLHKSPALYYSVMSLSALFMAQTGTNPQANDLALSLYQSTLHHLQAALFDTQEALQDTTLMATVIIGFYELIDKPSHESWASHSKGTAELIKLRAKQNFTTEMGKMLYRTFRGFEVLRAILQFDHTIVADAGWTTQSANNQTILSSKGLLPGHEAPSQQKRDDTGSPDYAAVLFMLGGQAANLQADLSRYSNETPKQSAQFMDRAMRIEQDLYAWRTNLPNTYNSPPQIVPSSGTNPTTTSTSSSSSTDPFMVGWQLCFYSAFTLLLHRSIAKYIHHDSKRVPSSDQALAKFILTTASSLTTGQHTTTMSLNMTWPVYMSSISLHSDDDRRWAMDVLRVIYSEKGWSVAQSALSAADQIVRKQKEAR